MEQIIQAYIEEIEGLLKEVEELRDRIEKFYLRLLEKEISAYEMKSKLKRKGGKK